MANQAAANSATIRIFRPSAVVTPNQPTVGRDDTDVADQQQHDAAEIPHRPAERRDPADVRRRRDLEQHRVVGDRAEFEEDRPEAQQQQAEPQVVVVVLDRTGPPWTHGQPGPDAHGQLAAATRVGPLAGHRGRTAMKKPAAPTTSQVLAVMPRQVLAHRVGEVDGVDEGDDDGVERRGSPVPQTPREDPAARHGGRVPRPLAAFAQDLAQQVGPVRQQPVDAEVEHPPHLLGPVDRPDVNLAAVLVAARTSRASTTRGGPALRARRDVPGERQRDGRADSGRGRASSQARERRASASRFAIDVPAPPPPRRAASSQACSNPPTHTRPHACASTTAASVGGTAAADFSSIVMRVSGSAAGTLVQQRDRLRVRAPGTFASSSAV